MAKYTPEEQLLIADTESRMLTPATRMRQALGLSKKDMEDGDPVLSTMLEVADRQVGNLRVQAEETIRQLWPATLQKNKP